MAVALVTGRGGSRSIKNKNVHPVLGRPLLAYPIMAANVAELVDHVFMTTDSELLADAAADWGAEIIMRPDALGEDQKHAQAMVHGYETICERLGEDPGILVILMANCPTVSPGIIDQGVRFLLEEDEDEEVDSCVTVSLYNEYNPMRARVVEDGLLKPAIDPSYFFEGGFMRNESGHDRDSAGDFYFCDGGAWIVRSRCMDLSRGELPYKWIGKTVKPLVQEFGGDVDNVRGLANAAFWLRRNGFSEDTTPYESGR